MKGFQDALGEENVLETKKILGTDETNAFSYAYEPAVPLLFFFYGSSNPKALEASKNGGAPLPSLHSAEFAPELKPTLNTGTKALIGLTLSVLEKKTR